MSRRRLQIDQLESRRMPAALNTLVYEDWNGDGMRQYFDPAIPGRKVYIDVNGNGVHDAPITTSHDYPGLPAAITDNGVLNSYLLVGGSNQFIVDVKVSLTLNHTRNEDLDIYLISPANTRVELCTDQLLNSQAPVTVELSDESEIGLYAFGKFGSNPYRPEEPLSKFYSEYPVGFWRLEVNDDQLGAAGSLLDWSLTITTGEPAAITGTNGFTSVNWAAGVWKAAVEYPNQWYPTNSASQTVILPSDNSSVLKLFGQRRNQSIYIHAFDDVNGNGKLDFDAEEWGRAGAMIYVDLDNDGTLDADEPLAITDLRGRAQFNDLPIGSYIVREKPSPWGQAPTTPTAQPIILNWQSTFASFGAKIDKSYFPTFSPPAPNPRNTPVHSVSIDFYHVVSGVDHGDFRLLRNDAVIPLTASQILATTDNQTFTLSNLEALTAAEGEYRLEFIGVGANVVGGNGKQFGPAVVEWTADMTPPRAFAAPVFPNPRSAPVSNVLFIFNEPVTGNFNQAFQVRRNGVVIGENLPGYWANSIYIVNQLMSLTSIPGEYEVELINGPNANIRDVAGNQLGTAYSIVSWTMETAAPTLVGIATNGQMTTDDYYVEYSLPFSEPVFGLSVNNFTIGAVNLPDAKIETITPAPTSYASWQVKISTGDLANVFPGSITLALTNPTGIQDSAGNGLVGIFPVVGPTYAIDRNTLKASIAPVTPNLRNTPVASIQIEFTHAVTGFDLADLSLQRDQQPNLLTSAQLLTSVDNKIWTLGNLTGLTSAGGKYRLTLTGFQSGITDAAGHPLPNSPVEINWECDVTPPFLTKITTAKSIVNAGTVVFTPMFSEAVTGVSTANFGLVPTNLQGATITGIVSIADQWFLQTNTGLPMNPPNPGYLYPRLINNSEIRDLAGNLLSTTFLNGPTVTVYDQPEVTLITFDDGTIQRSHVRSIDVYFDRAVNFIGKLGAAFTVAGESGVVIETPEITSASPTSVRLTFPGGASLADGKYSLTIHSGSIGNGLFGGDYTLTFHRLFGDSDGDADVDAIDFVAFRFAYGSNSWVFDSNGDGLVNAIDFIQFRTRFGISLVP